MHSGIGGLAHVLAEIAATRPWTAEESALAAAIGDAAPRRRPRPRPTSRTSTGWSATSSAWPAGGARRRRLRRAAARARAGRAGRTGTTSRSAPAAIVLGGLDRRSRRAARAGLELATYAADRLLAEAEETPAGLNWLFVPRRHGPAREARRRPAGRDAELVARRWPGSPARWPGPGSPWRGPTWSRPLGSAPSTSSPWPTRPRWPPAASPYPGGSRTSPTTTSTRGTGATARPATSRSSRRSTRPASLGGRRATDRLGRAAACTRCTPQASPSDAGRASGTTTAAAAAPPASARRCYRTTRARAGPGRRPRQPRVRRGRPGLLAVHRAPQPGAAAPAGRRLDAGGRGHRRVPLPGGPHPRTGTDPMTATACEELARTADAIAAEHPDWPGHEVLVELGLPSGRHPPRPARCPRAVARRPLPPHAAAASGPSSATGPPPRPATSPASPER